MRSRVRVDGSVARACVKLACIASAALSIATACAPNHGAEFPKAFAGAERIADDAAVVA